MLSYLNVINDVKVLRWRTMNWKRVYLLSLAVRNGLMLATLRTVIATPPRTPRHYVT
jgi:hypothetical protein